MMVAYPECFVWRGSLHASHSAVLTRRRCVTADRTVWTDQMKNAVVCINNLSGGRLVEVQKNRFGIILYIYLCTCVYWQEEKRTHSTIQVPHRDNINCSCNNVNINKEINNNDSNGNE